MNEIGALEAAKKRQQKIDEDVAAFLNAGGRIQQVEQGKMAGYKPNTNPNTNPNGSLFR